MGAQKGFTAVELLIAIAIILVIAAIGIPGLLNSRVAANESLAVAGLRQVTLAQSTYAGTYSRGYAAKLSQLGPPREHTRPGPAGAGLIDDVLGCALQPCIRDGYSFTIAAPFATLSPSYRVTAIPVHPGASGARGFCSDQTRRLLYDPQGSTQCTAKVE